MTIRDIAIKIGYDIDSKSYNDAVKSVQKLANTAKKVLGVVAVGAILNRLKSQVEQYVKLNNQLAYATDYMADMQVLQDRIQKASAASNIAYSSIAQSIKNMIQDTNTWQLSLDDSLGIAERLGKVFRGAGLSREESGSLVEQFSRNFANGRLMNLSDMIEQAPELVNYLGKSLNMTTQGVRALAMRNAITLKQFTKAIAENAEDIDARYSKVSLTITDALAYVKEKFFVWLSTDGKKIVNDIAQSIRKFGDKLGPMLTRVSEIINKLGGLPAILTRIAAIAATIKIFEKGIEFFQKFEMAKKTFSSIITALSAAGTKTSTSTAVSTVVASSASKGIGAVAKVLGKISWIVAAVYTAIKTNIEIAKFAAGKESETEKALEDFGFNVEGTRTETNTALSTIKDALLKIWDGISTFFGSIGEIFTGVLRTTIVHTLMFIQTVAPLLDVIGSVIQDILKFVSMLVAGFGKIVEKVNSIVTVLTYLVKIVIEPFFKSLQLLNTLLHTVGNAVLSWLGGKAKGNDKDTKWATYHKVSDGRGGLWSGTTLGYYYEPTEEAKALHDAGRITEDQWNDLLRTGTFEGADKYNELYNYIAESPKAALSKTGNNVTIIMDNHYTFNGADRSAQTKAAEVMDAAGEQVIGKMKNALAYGG